MPRNHHSRFDSEGRFFKTRESRSYACVIGYCRRLTVLDCKKRTWALPSRWHLIKRYIHHKIRTIEFDIDLEDCELFSEHRLFMTEVETTAWYGNWPEGLAFWLENNTDEIYVAMPVFQPPQYGPEPLLASGRQILYPALRKDIKFFPAIGKPPKPVDDRVDSGYFDKPKRKRGRPRERYNQDAPADDFSKETDDD